MDCRAALWSCCRLSGCQSVVAAGRLSCGVTVFAIIRAWKSRYNSSYPLVYITIVICRCADAVSSPGRVANVDARLLYRWSKIEQWLSKFDKCGKAGIVGACAACAACVGTCADVRGCSRMSRRAVACRVCVGCSLGVVRAARWVCAGLLCARSDHLRVSMWKQFGTVAGIARGFADSV